MIHHYISSAEHQQQRNGYISFFKYADEHQFSFQFKSRVPESLLPPRWIQCLPFSRLRVLIHSKIPFLPWLPKLTSFRKIWCDLNAVLSEQHNNFDYKQHKYFMNRTCQVVSVVNLIHILQGTRAHDYTGGIICYL